MTPTEVAVDALRPFLDRAPLPIWINYQGVIVYVNQAGLAVLRASSPDQVLGRTPFDFIGSEFHDRVRARIERLSHAGEPQPPLEERWRCVDGSPIDVEVAAWSIPFAGATAIQVSFTDLTVRKQALAASQVLAERLQFAREASEFVGVWDWDVRSDRVAADARFASLYGVDPEAGTAGLPISEFFRRVHPDDLPTLVREVDRAIAGADTYLCEYRLIQPDGSARWVLARGRCIRNAAGDVVRFPGAAVDITERKALEQALRESEERYRRVIEDNPVGIVIGAVTGPRKGHLSMVNDAYLRLIGYTRAEFEGGLVDWTRLTPPDSLPADEAGIAACLRDGRSKPYEKQYVHKDGHRVPILVAPALIPGTDEVFSFVLDLTERKHAEEARRETERMLDAVLDALPVATVIANAEGRLVRMNPACDEVWGRTAPRSDNVAAYSGYIGYHPGTGRRLQIHEWPLARAVTRGEVITRELYEIERLDDKHRLLVEISAAPVRDEQGKVLGGVVASMDVTERVRAEQALRASERRLDLLVRLGDATRTLDEPKEIASAAVRLLREHLGVDRVAWAEVEDDENHFTFVGSDAAPGVSPAVGRYPVSAFGLECLRVMRAGQPFACNDAINELPQGADRDAYLQTGICALIAVPVHKNGRFVAGVGVHSLVPRHWNQDEIEVVRAVTQRCWDSIERARAERAVRTSETTLSAVLDALPVGVVIADANGGILRDNTAHRDIWGLPPETGSWQDYGEWLGYWPDTGERIPAVQWAMARALLHGEIVRGELVECQPFGGGERRFFLNNAAPVRNADGRIIAGVIAEMDVTASRKSAQALQEREERYRLVVRATNDAIWDWNLLTNQIEWNPSLHDRFGYDLSQVDPDASWWLDRIHPDEWQRVHDDIVGVIDGGGEQWASEYRFRCAGGDYAEVLDRGFVVRDSRGRAVRMIGSMLDLTPQKRAAAALRESEARFRALAEAVPEALFTTTPAGECDYTSPSFNEFVGLSPAEVLGSGWTRALHPDDLARTVECWSEHVSAGKPVELEYRFRRHDGVYHWFIARATPMRDDSGAIIKWFGAATDIDAMKRTEAELRMANQDLESFAFAAAHDLQEPLRMVTSYTQLLARTLKDRLRDQEEVFMDHIVSGAMRMSLLLKDLLAYTETGRDGDCADVDLNKALEEALTNLKSAVSEEGASVEAGGLPTVIGRYSNFVQLFQNLVGNAIRYRSAEPPRIRITSRRQGSDWLIQVADNGEGIAPQYHERIFGVFKRLHGREIPGTGIGLAICQRVVERAGGRIWVESPGKGHGSTFFFTLPAA